MALTRTRLLAWILLALALLLGPSAGASAQGPDQVAVVVQFSEDNVATYCVALDAPEITGLEALQRTGLSVAYLGGALGAQVCKIGLVGCDLPGDCFCQCKGQECLYWSYWHLVDGTWQYAIAGAGSYEVTPGSVEGWSWGIGTPNRAPQPPLVSFEQVCAAPTATPSSTPSPSATPPPTDTPSPSPTPRPTDTAAPTATEAVAPYGRDSVPVPSATATTTAAATSTPTQAPAAESTSSPMPSGPAPTLTPSPPPQAPTATAVPTGAPGPGSTNYIFLGAIVLVLLALGAYVLLRRR